MREASDSATGIVAAAVRAVIQKQAEMVVLDAVRSIQRSLNRAVMDYIASLKVTASIEHARDSVVFRIELDRAMLLAGRDAVLNALREKDT